MWQMAPSSCRILQRVSPCEPGSSMLVEDTYIRTSYL